MAQYKNFTLLADPPTHPFPQHTQQLTPASAQTFLAAYLARARSDAALHPDAWLSTAGVKFGPRGGAGGGITMHYLGRIEAGLRGEDLAAETREDLAARFGGEGVAVAAAEEEEEGLPAGEDSRVDATIAAERKENGKKSKKRKRGEEIEAWAEKSASEAGGLKREEREEGWMTKGEYEQSQTIWEGEVGERDATHAVDQNGAVPDVVTHKTNGDVKRPKPEKTAEQKAARKAAKTAKVKEQKKRAAAVKNEAG